MVEVVDYIYFFKKIEEIERELKEIKFEFQNFKKLIYFIFRVIEIRGEFGGYKFRKFFMLNVEREVGIWCVENREFEVYGCGFMLNDVFYDVEKVFEVLIEEYVLEDEEIFDESVKELRKVFFQFVEVQGYEGKRCLVGIGKEGFLEKGGWEVYEVYFLC